MQKMDIRELLTIIGNGHIPNIIHHHLKNGTT
jgi:hypothetical protein